MQIHEVPTPALLLDIDVLERNLQRMAARAEALAVSLRPHIKTHKCVEIGARQRELGAQGITVATLHEAEVFAEHGFGDIIWAFPVVLSRVPQVVALAELITLRVVVDSLEAVEALERTRAPLHVWLKVDCGYHRAGLDPTGELVVDLARRVCDSHDLMLDGILTHSGHAYHADSAKSLETVARQERDVMVTLTDRLRAAGLDVPGVSVGSTPAMSAVDHLDGVTEVRPGNYAFYDYTQVLIGAARPEDCALTVLTSVVSAPESQRHSVVDAGALALSKDTGRGDTPHASMGEVYKDYRSGNLHDDVRLTSVSQEHGILSASLRVGDQVRVLPNHSCLTAACWDEYTVVKGEEVVDRWKIWRARD